MALTNLLITNVDRQRVGTAIDKAIAPSRSRRSEFIAFETELDLAHSVLSEEIPDDVVTMNSTVEVCDLETQDTETFTLVYPECDDINRNRISVLAPVGQALLGRRVGDVVQIVVPAGRRRIRIVRLPYQPEQAGNYDL
jgi:regulator of nucleoside diphosphate kinase